MAEREIAFADRMTDHEALMWNIEKDPWLSPNGSSMVLLDRPLDLERFRRQVRYGVSRLPRLYQRVVPGLGRLSTPAWVPDPEFDFDHHIRHIDLPAPGTERQLLDLAAQLASEPLDRTRPLWRFVVIGGLEGGRGALWSIFHHAISDGIGQIRMAELYQQLTRDDEGHPEVDLEAIVAEACAAANAKEAGGDLATGFVSTAGRTATHLARRNLGLGRRALGELMLWPADPDRGVDKATGAVAAVRHTVGQLTGDGNEVAGGSALWSTRSRHRHLEWIRIPLDDLKTAAKARGGSINDALIAVLIEAAAAYHADRDAPVEAFNTSFVLSTRSDNKIGGNSFTPVVIQLDGRPSTPTTRIAEVHDATAAARESASHGGGVSAIAGVANLLPTSVMTRIALDQAAKIDLATSNLRGAPFELFCAGARVDAIVCLGPVAGTAGNITAMSYDRHLDLGVYVDPVAIDDPEGFAADIRTAVEALLGASA